MTRFIDAANRIISVEGTRFAYRELGPRGGVPLVLLNHWGAVLDNFDPRIVDGATKHVERLVGMVERTVEIAVLHAVAAATEIGRAHV